MHWTVSSLQKRRRINVWTMHELPFSGILSYSFSFGYCRLKAVIHYTNILQIFALNKSMLVAQSQRKCADIWQLINFTENCILIFKHDSVQSEDIRHVWYFEPFSEYIGLICLVPHFQWGEGFFVSWLWSEQFERLWSSVV